MRDDLVTELQQLTSGQPLPTPGRVSAADFQRGYLPGQQTEPGKSTEPRIPTPKPIKASDFGRGTGTVEGSADSGIKSGARTPVSPEEALGLSEPRAGGDYGQPSTDVASAPNKDSSGPERADFGDADPSSSEAEADITKAFTFGSRNLPDWFTADRQQEEG